MPTPALRCLVKLDIADISAPGVWLSNREDVFVNIELFGQKRASQLCRPNFPIAIEEKYRFDKVFYNCRTSKDVAKRLYNEFIVIELIQLSDTSKGRLLAYYETCARDFLFPFPPSSPKYFNKAPIMMERTVHFSGIAPRITFSAEAFVSKTEVPTLDVYNDLDLIRKREKANYVAPRSPRLKKKRGRGLRVSRPTLASISRSRSLSPSLEQRMDDMTLLETGYSVQDDDLSDRPPFVVRKTKEDLIGRTPGSGHPKKKKSSKRHRGISPGRVFYEASAPYATNPPWYVEGRKSPHRDLYRSYSEEDDDCQSYDGRITPKYRAASLYSSLDDGRETSLRIAERVDRALRRNRSLERLTDAVLADSPRRRYTYDYDYDSLDDLEAELEHERQLRRSAYKSKAKDDLSFWKEKSECMGSKNYRDRFNQDLNIGFRDLYNRALESV